MATASPAKFPEAVTKSLSMEGNLSHLSKNHWIPETISNLSSLQTRYDKMMVGENWTAILRAKIEAISANVAST